MTDKTITEIRQFRGVNNILWMQVLEIALRHAPAETKIILRSINANDQNISNLLTELAK